MKSVVVVSLSLGTALLVFFMTTLVVGAVMLVHFADTTPPPNAKVFEPKSGMLGEIHRQKHEMEYGPVDLNKAKETKDGIIDNIRARRQARAQAYCQNVQARATYCQPAQTYTQSYYRIAEPTDCNTGYSVVTPNVSVSVQPNSVGVAVSPPVIEYPSTKPQASQATPRSPAPPPCVDGSCRINKTTKATPRKEAKTGAFVCSNCRKPCIGDEWHTEWNADGTPTTFLCESCHQSLDEEQRERVYLAYAARQAKHSCVGTLHQEVAK